MLTHTDIKNQYMSLNNGDSHKYLDKQINSEHHWKDTNSQKMTAKNKSKHLESN